LSITRAQDQLTRCHRFASHQRFDFELHEPINFPDLSRAQDNFLAGSHWPKKFHLPNLGQQKTRLCVWLMRRNSGGLRQRFG